MRAPIPAEMAPGPNPSDAFQATKPAAPPATIPDATADNHSLNDILIS
jgi:hypothetical protein